MHKDNHIFRSLFLCNCSIAICTFISLFYTLFFACIAAQPITSTYFSTQIGLHLSLQRLPLSSLHLSYLPILKLLKNMKRGKAQQIKQNVRTYRSLPSCPYAVIPRLRLALSLPSIPKNLHATLLKKKYQVTLPLVLILNTWVQRGGLIPMQCGMCNAKCSF